MREVSLADVRQAASESRVHEMTPERYIETYESIWGESDDGHYATVAAGLELVLIEQLTVMLFDIGQHCEVEFVPFEDKEEEAVSSAVIDSTRSGRRSRDCPRSLSARECGW